jgi:hypothetical protein
MIESKQFFAVPSITYTKYFKLPDQVSNLEPSG